MLGLDKKYISGWLAGGVGGAQEFITTDSTMTFSNSTMPSDIASYIPAVGLAPRVC